MHAPKDKTYQDLIAYYLRRAQDERRRAEAARSDHERAGRIEMAEIFEARAAAVPAMFGLLPTLH